MVKQHRKKQAGGSISDEDLTLILMDGVNQVKKELPINLDKVELVNRFVKSRLSETERFDGPVSYNGVLNAAQKHNIDNIDFDLIQGIVWAMNKHLQSPTDRPQIDYSSFINSIQIPEYSQTDDKLENFEKQIAQEQFTQFMVRNPVVFAVRDLTSLSEEDREEFLPHVWQMQKDFYTSFIENKDSKVLKFMSEIVKDKKNKEMQDLLQKITKGFNDKDIVESLKADNPDDFVANSEPKQPKQPIKVAFGRKTAGGRFGMELAILAGIPLLCTYVAGVLVGTGVTLTIGTILNMVSDVVQLGINKVFDGTELTINQIQKLKEAGWYMNHYHDSRYDGPRNLVELVAAEEMFSKAKVASFMNKHQEVKNDKVHDDQYKKQCIRKLDKICNQFPRNLITSKESQLDYSMNSLIGCKVNTQIDLHWYKENKEEVKKFAEDNQNKFNTRAKNFKLSKHRGFRGMVEGAWNILKLTANENVGNVVKGVGKLTFMDKIFEDPQPKPFTPINFKAPINFKGGKVSLLGRSRKIIRDGGKQYVMIKGVKTTLKQAKLLHKQDEKKKREAKSVKTRSR
jgi:hypothetical protein